MEIEVLVMRGHLKVYKIYDTHNQLVIDKDNIVTTGFGYTLARMMTFFGSQDLDDYRIKYYQIGTNTILHSDNPDFYNLSGQLAAESDWGDDTNANIQSINQLYNTQILTAGSSLITSSGFFAKIPDNNVTHFAKNAIAIKLFVDKNTANGQTLKEIGIFSKNPDGETPDKACLVAYNTFEGLSKTIEFGLYFDWILHY